MNECMTGIVQSSICFMLFRMTTNVTNIPVSLPTHLLLLYFSTPFPFLGEKITLSLSYSMLFAASKQINSQPFLYLCKPRKVIACGYLTIIMSNDFQESKKYQIVEMGLHCFSLQYQNWTALFSTIIHSLEKKKKNQEGKPFLCAMCPSTRNSRNAQIPT